VQRGRGYREEPQPDDDDDDETVRPFCRALLAVHKLI